MRQENFQGTNGKADSRPVMHCFMDIVSKEAEKYAMDHTTRLLRNGGLILADNALWYGRDR